MIGTFTIPGEPRGKQRARTGRGRTYTPDQTVRFENLVQVVFREAFPDWIPTDRAVAMKLTAIMSIPASVSAKKRRLMIEGRIRPVRTPDWDNLGKIVADSLNKILYRDDRQVVDGRVRKFYGEVPGITVLFEVLE